MQPHGTLTVASFFSYIGFAINNTYYFIFNCRQARRAFSFDPTLYDSLPAPLSPHFLLSLKKWYGGQVPMVTSNVLTFVEKDGQ